MRPSTLLTLRPFALLTLALMFASAAFAKPDPPPDHWVSSWGTAPYALDNRENTFGAADRTYREIIHPTLAGPLMRITLSNEFGTEPLTVGAVHIALSLPGGAIQLTSAHAMTFGGKPSIIIPPGAVAVSDPAAQALKAGDSLAVSIFIPAQKLTHVTFHGSANTTSYSAAGNVVGAASLPSPATFFSWYFLKSLEVKTTYNTAAVIAFGDSITDGAGSTLDVPDNWPALLSKRLQADKKTRELSVINEGIGGNRILHDGNGPSALARFDSVLALPGIRYVILLEGINDIGHAKDLHKPYDDVSSDDLIQGLAQLATRAHDHGIKVIGATLTPYMGAGYSSPAGEVVRKELNAWIRTTKSLDGVIDFDAATRDPQNPDTFRQNMQRGDQLHPNPTGYKAMADSVNLKLFILNKKEKYDITHQE